MKTGRPRAKIPRQAVQIQLDRDLALKARIHRAKTGESVSALISRLLEEALRERFAANEPPPAV